MNAKSTRYTAYVPGTRCILWLLIPLFMTACASPSNPTAGEKTGGLTGVVATRGTGVTIEAQRGDGVSRVTTADAQGHYTFENLEAGAYRLFATAPGYSRSTHDGTIDVLISQTVEAGDIVLNWTGTGVPDATLTGLITDAVTELPVEGVFLNVACDPNEIICLGRSAFTDAHGRYTIQSIPPDFGFDLFIGKSDSPNHVERGHLLNADQIQTLNVQIGK
jgi:hypothetical protein